MSVLNIVLKFRCFHNFTSSFFPCAIILTETIFSLSLSLLIFSNEVSCIQLFISDTSSNLYFLDKVTSSTTLHEVRKTCENWFHYGMFVNGPLKESLRNVLHNISNDPSYVGLPINPVLLYRELEEHRNVLDHIFRKKILSDDQMALLFPANKLQTDSVNFDIPLLVVLIMHFTNLPRPVLGWNAATNTITDQSIAANVICARELNNDFHLTMPRHLDKKTFDAKWEEGDNVVRSLGYTYDSQALKTEPLYPTKSSVVHLMILFLQYEQRDLKIKINSIDADINSRGKMLPDAKEVN